VFERNAAQREVLRRPAFRQAVASFMLLVRTREHGLRWGFCVTVTEPRGVS
jgi:hypothetical protein